MNILNIDKSKKEVVVTLSADELIKLCNCMYKTDEKNQEGIFHNLYGELIIARELSQYGHIDNWALSKIIEQRKHCGFELESKE